MMEKRMAETRKKTEESGDVRILEDTALCSPRCAVGGGFWGKRRGLIR